MIIGFMIVIQIRSIQSPREFRETRDMWEIRTQLQAEQERLQQLQYELNTLINIENNYHESTEQEQIQTLNDSIEELERKSGLTELTDEGVVIELKPNNRLVAEAREHPELTPELLNRLINELNTYGATDISVENERLINHTPIRYVSGKTYMNSRPLPSLPIEIKILSENPERLMNYLEVSQSRDEFRMNNMEFNVRVEEVTIPSYHSDIRLDLLQYNQGTEAGDS